MARLREDVADIRRSVTAGTFEHLGSTSTRIRARSDQEPVPTRVPVHVAGEGTRMVALAGEMADRAILDISTRWYLHEVAFSTGATWPRTRGASSRRGRDHLGGDVLR